MQLVLDIGNTLFKTYVFEQNKILSNTANPIANWKNSLLETLHNFPQIDRAIVSDVNTSFSEDLKLILAALDVIHCSTAIKLPFKTLYSPENQLGADRIALIASARLYYPNQEVLVIDLGSCITNDWIDSMGIHQGGGISPGFQMRYKSMHQFSGKLPQLEIEKAKSPVGRNTKEAMHSGVYFGITNELEGLIDWHRNKIENLTVILTGGDAEMLPKPFKNSIFAHSNFLAKGLKHILDMNTTS